MTIQTGRQNFFANDFENIIETEILSLRKNSSCTQKKGNLKRSKAENRFLNQCIRSRTKLMYVFDVILRDGA